MLPPPLRGGKILSPRQCEHYPFPADPPYNMKILPPGIYDDHVSSHTANEDEKKRNGNLNLKIYLWVNLEFRNRRTPTGVRPRKRLPEMVLAASGEAPTNLPRPKMQSGKPTVGPRAPPRPQRATESQNGALEGAQGGSLGRAMGSHFA